MNARLALVLVLCLSLLAGCRARPTTEPQERTSASSNSRAALEEPEASVRATHGDNLVRASVTPTAAADAVLSVELRDGAPAGRQPFRDLRLLWSMRPRRQVYKVEYRSTDETLTYIWSTRASQVLIKRGDSPLHGGLSQYVDGVNGDAMKAIAEGVLPVPRFAGVR